MKKYLMCLFVIAAFNANAESSGATFAQKGGESANQASPDGWTISQEGRTGNGNANDKRISIGTESKYTDKKSGSDIFTGKDVDGSKNASISVGSDSYKRQIKNVEKGIDDYDAVNVEQLKGLKTYTDNKTSGIKDAAVNESNTYTDRKFNQLDKKIDRGLASSAAMSMLFQPYGIGKFNLTAGVGGYGSETAIAIGSGYRFDENKAVKAGVASSTSSSSKLTYGASVNFEW